MDSLRFNCTLRVVKLLQIRRPPPSNPSASWSHAIPAVTSLTASGTRAEAIRGSSEFLCSRLRSTAARSVPHWLHSPHPWRVSAEPSPSFRQTAMPSWTTGAAPAVHCSSTAGGVANSAASAEGQQLLHYWDDVFASLAANTGVAPSHSEESVRQLLQAAVRLRSGRTQGFLPEKLLATLMRFYTSALPPQNKPEFFRLLTSEFGVNEDEVHAAVLSWQKATGRGIADGNAAGQRSPEAVARATERLSQAAQPLYSHLFVPISQLPGGIKFLVDMRADLAGVIRQSPSGAAPLRALSNALRRALAEWFSVGLLRLERLTWGSCSAELLERVMRYEAVHPMADWADLRQRLYPNRRVYAFFRPTLPEEPLVMVHAALRRGIATSIDALLQENRAGSEQQALAAAAQATTAVFYSISSTQAGLSGIDLGNFLIKRAAHLLLQELPALHTLVTLSPIPGFAAWLGLQLLRAADAERHGAPAAESACGLLHPIEAVALQAAAGKLHLPAAATGISALSWALDSNHWLQHPQVEAALRPVLSRAAARYLLAERRRGAALDPVANFHLRNGAWLWQLNWRADMSAKGLAASHGLMVNYRYILDDVQANNSAYVTQNIIAASPAVIKLAGQGSEGPWREWQAEADSSLAGRSCL